MNVVRGRYVRPGLDDAALDDLNERTEIERQESGGTVPSTVSIGDCRDLHVAITNRRSDFALLVREAIRVGYEPA